MVSLVGRLVGTESTRNPDVIVFAFVLWIAFVITGRGPIGWPLIIVYAGLTLLAHLAYGFTLGAVYARLRTEIVEMTE